MPLDNTQADDWVLPDEDTRKQASFKRNSGWTKQGADKFRTDLSPSEEAQFKAWVKANNVPNDDSPQADYDMRGFWKALQAKDPIATSAIDPNDKKLHYPDRWKTPYHETFSNESQWADPKKAPKWNDKDQLVGQDGKVLFDDRAHKPAEVDDWVVGAEAKKDEPTAKEPAKKDDLATRPTPVTDAIGQGVREGWRGAEPFLSDEKIDALKKTGGMTEGLAGAITAVNAAPKVLGAAIGGVEGAAYAGLSKVLPERLARDIVGMPQSLAGSPEMLRTPEAPAEVAPRPPRAEPTTAAPTPIEEAGVKPTPTPPPGGGEKPGSTPLDQAGLTPTAEPPPGPAAPAGTPPAPPEPATGTETVAQPQGDGTVTQVKVQTGGKPPGEPPQEPPKGTPAEPTSPGDFRSLFPNMTDEAFNALFREAAD